MKKIGFYIIIVIIILVSTLLISRKVQTARFVTQETITVHSPVSCPANNRQYKASVWIGENNGKLFFLIPWERTRSLYEGWLCTFENGKIIKVIQLSQSSSDLVDILGSSGQYLYYYTYPQYSGGNSAVDDVYKLMCCNMDTKEITVLRTDEHLGNRNAVFSEDGFVYIPLFSKESPGTYLKLQGNEVICISETAERCKLIEKEYYLSYSYNDFVEHVMVQNESGEKSEIPLGLALERSIIETEEGVLIHNKGRQDLLYYIKPDGTLTELFSIPCSFSRSAVTVYHNTVYLSFMRYEKGSEDWIGMVGFDHDEQTGTYRISLTDFSVEKKSDSIYDGLYIFDDTGIFACDKNKNIYKLDFDGNIVETLPSRIWRLF